jgi:hypothetical protein
LLARGEYCPAKLVDGKAKPFNMMQHSNGNVGYLYGSGLDDDFFAGPEIGITAGAFNVRVVYDMLFDRDAGEGVVAATIGYGFRF